MNCRFNSLPRVCRQRGGIRSQEALKVDHLARTILLQTADSRKFLHTTRRHSLRHLFANKAYAVTIDLLAVQTLLGHADPKTTMRYTQAPDTALLAAVQAAAN